MKANDDLKNKCFPATVTTSTLVASACLFPLALCPSISTAAISVIITTTTTTFVFAYPRFSEILEKPKAA